MLLKEKKKYTKIEDDENTLDKDQNNVSTP